MKNKYEMKIDQTIEDIIFFSDPSLKGISADSWADLVNL
mgnify:CR=1 FL=1